jgi:diguanylate cyclase
MITASAQREELPRLLANPLAHARVLRTRGVSATVSRAASFGLAVVLALLAGFTLSSVMVSNRRATDVAEAVRLNNAYRDASLDVASAESLERKYRLEPSPQVLARYDAAVSSLKSSLEEIIASGDSVGAEPARQAMAGFDVYRLAISRMFAAVDAEQTALVLQIDGAEVDPTFGQIDELVKKGAAAQATATGDAISRLRRTESAFAILAPSVFVLGFVLLGLFTWAIRKYRQQIDHQALHDSLTGLPNRNFFHRRSAEALEAANRSGAKTAVLLVDLDRFKEINDTLGHHYGDLVLTELSRRLESQFGATDGVARLGGDEFAVLLSEPTSLEDATDVAVRLLLAIRKPISIGELRFDVDASIGIALSPDHGTTVDELLQRADVAMYVAKANHMGYSTYSADDDLHSPERLAILGDLRRAIESNELVLFYQPKVRLHDGVGIGVEALVRWNHPTRGLVPPDDFIPLAERTSLIEPLTTWVLTEAMTQTRRWLDEGHRIPVAVNISARSIVSLDFAGHVAELLRQTGAPAELIELEVTESAMMTDPERARLVLEELHLLGLRLAIDDFGTGYSSLAYLRTLPINVLKVDRVFIANMLTVSADRVIVRSVIELGHNLGLSVVAEGVEDDDIAVELGRYGCDEAQGYFWNKALPADEFFRWHQSRITGIAQTASSRS